MTPEIRHKLWLSNGLAVMMSCCGGVESRHALRLKPALCLGSHASMAQAAKTPSRYRVPSRSSARPAAKEIGMCLGEQSRDRSVRWRAQAVTHQISLAPEGTPVNSRKAFAGGMPAAKERARSVETGPRPDH